MKTWWAGYIYGTNRGKIFVGVKNLGDAVKGDMVFKDFQFGTSIIKFKGRLNNNQIRADIFDFVFSRPLPLEPQTGQISMVISEDNNEISGTWATDVGTHGQCRLFKINFLRAFPISLPFLYRMILIIKRWVMTNLKYLYLVLSFLVLIASITGVLKEKISITETIILMIPLIFLFRKEIRDFFLITGLKKIGPVEFQEQSGAPVGINQETIRSFVHEYGELFPHFVILNQFFVPRTKAILRILATETSPVPRQYFDRLAQMLGIEEGNIQVTYDVLVQNRYLEIDQDGRIRITEIGRKFLEFESKFNQLFPR